MLDTDAHTENAECASELKQKHGDGRDGKKQKQSETQGVATKCSCNRQQKCSGKKRNKKNSSGLTSLPGVCKQDDCRNTYKKNTDGDDETT